MRKSINEAISSTVSDMLEIGLETSFTKKELDEMDVQITLLLIHSVDNSIQATKETTKLIKTSKTNTKQQSLTALSLK